MNTLRCTLKIAAWRCPARTVTVKSDVKKMHATAADVKKKVDGPTDAKGDDISEKIVLAQEKLLELLKRIECKLPVWQSKISDAMQSVQDYVTSKLKK